MTLSAMGVACHLSGLALVAVRAARPCMRAELNHALPHVPWVHDFYEHQGVWGALS